MSNIVTQSTDDTNHFEFSIDEVILGNDEQKQKQTHIIEGNFKIKQGNPKLTENKTIDFGKDLDKTDKEENQNIHLFENTESLFENGNSSVALYKPSNENTPSSKFLKNMNKLNLNDC